MKIKSVRVLFVLVMLFALASLPTIVLAKGFVQDAPPPLTETVLASIAGILLSLAFSYFPGLSDWFARQDANKKRLVVLTSLVVAAVAVFVLSCASLAIYVSCDKAGAWTLVGLLFNAIVANQATYLLTPARTS